MAERAPSSVALELWPSPLRTVSGAPVPALAFGLGTRHRHVSDDVTANALRAALHAGFRHIDCARFYGTEAIAGRVLAEGLVPRRELFLTSKLWMTHHDDAGVAESVNASLAALGLEYLDMLLIHWPVAWTRDSDPADKARGVTPRADVPLVATWRAMERLVAAGRVRALGVSNCGVAELDEILGSDPAVRPTINQVECHPQCAQTALRDACAARGVRLACFGPLWPQRAAAEGGGGGGGAAAGSARVVAACAAAAAAHGRSTTQVLLRWLIQRACMPVTTSSNPERVRQSFGALDFTLTDAEMAAIDDAGARAPFRRYNPLGWREPPDALWFAPDDIDASESRPSQAQSAGSPRVVLNS